MSAKPEVMQFVMEKLALPAWLRRMKGFVKGKRWPAWAGEARSAGRVRAHQHATQKLMHKRQDLRDFNVMGADPALKSQERVLGRQMSREMEGIRQNLTKVPDPRHRQLLTQSYERGAGYVHPSLHTSPQTRLQHVKDLMSGPAQMSRQQAVRHAAGIPSRPLPFPSETAQALAPDRFMRHVVPPKGGTGVFEAMYARAPAQLQRSSRFADAMGVVNARKVGLPTAPPQGIKLPPRMQFNTAGHPLLNLRPPTRPELVL